MTLQNKLLAIQTALTSISGLKVYHFLRPQLEPPYCVWQEDGEDGSLWLSNHQAEQVLTGTIDYFTQDEYDGVSDEIQTALNSIENCGWSLNSVQYEEDTELIHYEWLWRIG